MTMRTLGRVVAMLLLAPCVAGAQAVEPKFRLAGTTLQLPPGEPAGRFEVVVLANLAKEDVVAKEGVATLVDATPNATGASVRSSTVTTTTELRQVWKFDVTVEGVPKDESQARVFVLSYGEFHERLEYTLANTTTKTFAWSVKAPTEWNLGSMKALAIAVRVADVTATNFVLQQVALAGDDKQKRTLGVEHFELCQNATDKTCVKPPVSLSPREPYTFYLRPTRALPAGTYKGNMFVAATEKADPEVLQLTLYNPDPAAVAWGFGALIAGVLASLVVQVFGRSFIQQRQDHQAVELLRERLQQSVGEFNALPDNLRQAAKTWLGRSGMLDRDITVLKGSARSLVPSPFADEVTQVETLKAGLERLAKEVLLLRTIVREALKPVEAIQRQSPALRADAEAAAEQMASISSAEDVPKKIGDIIATLRGEVASRGGVAMLAAAPRSAAAKLQSLKLQVVAVSYVVWLIWAAVSVLTGALVLIYQNPAFGTDVDVLTCLVWGLGVSIAGQQASQLTPGGVAQAVGVKLPAAK